MKSGIIILIGPGAHYSMQMFVVWTSAEYSHKNLKDGHKCQNCIELQTAKVDDCTLFSDGGQTSLQPGQSKRSDDDTRSIYRWNSRWQIQEMSILL